MSARGGEKENSLRSSERVESSTGRQYHLDIAPGELAPSILMVGDPARVERIASRFDRVDLRRAKREFVTVTGIHRGLPVSVIGTGIGAASTEIAVVELSHCIERPTLIRCGSTGSLREEAELGSLVITQGAYRLEETSLSFVGPGYPALAHPEVQMALAQAADQRQIPHHLGITATAPGFYGAQGRKLEALPPRDTDLLDRLTAEGVLNLEMECSCLLTLASLIGARAGAVCAVYANRPQGVFIDDEAMKKAEDDCVSTGLEALHLLAKRDAERQGKPLWHPGLG